MTKAIYAFKKQMTLSITIMHPECMKTANGKLDFYNLFLKLPNGTLTVRANDIIIFYERRLSGLGVG